jgi:putative Mn2+ efflux pump MntP
MKFIELFLIGVSLAMDAFAVSIGKGLSLTKVRPRHAISAGVWFGGFQALMPIVGFFLGCSLAHIVERVDHWIAFGLLVIIGLNMIRETLSGDKEDHNADFGFRTMLIMAIATSIDALTVGVTMAFLNVNIWVAAMVIGVVTFAFSAVGVSLGSKLGSKVGSRAGIVGGAVLICLGIKILIEHLGLLQ